ncbi:MAG: hypothetical protein JOZ29_18740 [Deltaproteobacteria bacterium]|nr:hypothetical protein [Deltaproteobacteria bacterium]
MVAIRYAWQGVEKCAILGCGITVALNTLRKDGFLPYLLSRFFAGEIREGEQAVIYQQPAGDEAISSSGIELLLLTRGGWVEVFLVGRFRYRP